MLMMRATAIHMPTILPSTTGAAITGKSTDTMTTVVLQAFMYLHMTRQPRRMCRFLFLQFHWVIL